MTRAPGIAAPLASPDGDLPPPEEGYRCAIASASRREPMLATASSVVRWLLVEQPGPWEAAAPPRGRMAPEVHERCVRAAAAAGARLMTIRRPGRREPAVGRTILAAESRTGTERLLRRTIGWDDDLADLSVPAPDNPAPAGWERVEHAVFLACTHGQHDVCCALAGRPVAAALASAGDVDVWECSHLGGDRFAGNLAVLPAGHYFGRVDAATALQVAAAYRDGRLVAEHLRGRSSLMMPAQAAQHFARAQTGLDGVGDLAATRVFSQGPDTWRVLLDAPDGTVEVTVRRTTTGGATERLTCAAPSPQHPASFELVELVRHHT